MSTKTTTNPIVNGVDTEALRGAMAAIEADSAAAATNWKVTSRWQGGTRADHHVDGFGIGGQWVERRFTLKTDEPLELCGTNQHANPQEHLMASINACMMVGYSAVAALMGIELESLEVELKGDIDLRGFLALDDTIVPGYPQLEQTVRITAPSATPEQLEELHAAVQATSPNFYNITHAIPTRSTLVIG